MSTEEKRGSECSCLVPSAAEASRVIQEHDFVGLQGSGDSRRHLRRVQHYRATAAVPPHRTEQWDGPAVQAPLEEADVHSNMGWGTDGRGTEEGEDNVRGMVENREEGRDEESGKHERINTHFLKDTSKRTIHDGDGDDTLMMTGLNSCRDILV